MTKYIYQMVKCPFCDELRKTPGIHLHIKTHGLEKWNEYQVSRQKTSKYHFDQNSYNCIECHFSSNTRQSVTAHWWRNHTNDGKLHKVYGASGAKKAKKRKSPPWNKGLTKETDERLKKLGETISIVQQQKIANGTFIPSSMGIKARTELSERQTLNNSGGKSKWFEVNGKKVQGTYEKQFAEKLEIEKIEWIRIQNNNHIFKYKKDGKTKSYSPDFYLPKFDLYVEIKGFWWGDDENKMITIKENHSDKKLIVLFGKKKLDYVCEDIENRLLLEPLWSW